MINCSFFLITGKMPNASPCDFIIAMAPHSGDFRVQERTIIPGSNDTTSSRKWMITLYRDHFRVLTFLHRKQKIEPHNDLMVTINLASKAKTAPKRYHTKPENKLHRDILSKTGYPVTGFSKALNSTSRNKKILLKIYLDLRIQMKVFNC